jgi:hypothetical protein
VVRSLGAVASEGISEGLKDLGKFHPERVVINRKNLAPESLQLPLSLCDYSLPLKHAPL